MINVVCQRRKWRKGRTPSDLVITGQFTGVVLEDELREVPGIPVEQWKVKDETAIPEGDYKMGLRDSPAHGKEALTLLNVPGFDLIDVHGGNKAKDTKGCPLVGLELNDDDEIPGGKSQPALKKLREILVPAIKRGDEVIWSVRNPPGYQGPPKADPIPKQREDEA